MSNGWFLSEGNYVRLCYPYTDFEERYRSKNSDGAWIYAAQEAGTSLVKIGCSRRLRERLGALNAEPGSTIILIAAVFVEYARPFLVESRIHRRLRAEHIAHEWFYLHMNQTILEQLVREAFQHITLIAVMACVYQNRKISKGRSLIPSCAPPHHKG